MMANSNAAVLGINRYQKAISQGIFSNSVAFGIKG